MSSSAAHQAEELPHPEMDSIENSNPSSIPLPVKKKKWRKKVNTAPWSLRENFALVSTIELFCGVQNWPAVSSLLIDKGFADERRPNDWFSPENCAVQYDLLMEKYGTMLPPEQPGETLGQRTERYLRSEYKKQLQIDIIKSEMEIEKANQDVHLLLNGSPSEKLLDEWEVEMIAELKEMMSEEEVDDDEVVVNEEILPVITQPILNDILLPSNVENTTEIMTNMDSSKQIESEFEEESGTKKMDSSSSEDDNNAAIKCVIHKINDSNSNSKLLEVNQDNKIELILEDDDKPSNVEGEIEKDLIHDSFESNTSSVIININNNDSSGSEEVIEEDEVEEVETLSELIERNNKLLQGEEVIDVVDDEINVQNNNKTDDEEENEIIKKVNIKIEKIDELVAEKPDEQLTEELINDITNNECDLGNIESEHTEETCKIIIPNQIIKSETIEIINNEVTKLESVISTNEKLLASIVKEERIIETDVTTNSNNSQHELLYNKSTKDNIILCDESTIETVKNNNESIMNVIENNITIPLPLLSLSSSSCPDTTQVNIKIENMSPKIPSSPVQIIPELELNVTFLPKDISQDNVCLSDVNGEHSLSLVNGKENTLLHIKIEDPEINHKLKIGHFKTGMFGYDDSLSTCSSPTPSEKTAKMDDDHKVFKKAIQLLHGRITGHKNASLFHKPIKEEKAPGYYRRILRPMDLSTIRKRIDSGDINSIDSYERDLSLMLVNAVFYNSNNPDITRLTKEMAGDVWDLIDDYKSTQQLLQYNSQYDSEHGESLAVFAIRRTRRRNSSITTTLAPTPENIIHNKTKQKIRKSSKLILVPSENLDLIENEDSIIHDIKINKKRKDSSSSIITTMNEPDPKKLKSSSSTTTRKYTTSMSDNTNNDKSESSKEYNVIGNNDVTPTTIPTIIGRDLRTVAVKPGQVVPSISMDVFSIGSAPPDQNSTTLNKSNNNNSMPMVLVEQWIGPRPEINGKKNEIIKLDKNKIKKHRYSVVAHVGGDDNNDNNSGGDSHEDEHSDAKHTAKSGGVKLSQIKKTRRAL